VDGVKILDCRVTLGRSFTEGIVGAVTVRGLAARGRGCVASSANAFAVVRLDGFVSE
jgi:hypothetical protein